jgi:lysophospholipase L1-like esterase
MDVKFETMNLKEEFDRGIINTGNLFRIAKVMKRGLSGEAIKVGFIGGSITQGAAATTPITCYAYRVYLWWTNRFPSSQIEYINAGVGATTSKFGVARVEDDLLKEEPDIIFAEFSVNDTGNELFQDTFEGLVRKILLYPSEPALFMFNNVFYDDGRNAQQIHNEVGRYYELPIVSIRESIYAEIVKGTLKNTEISTDNLHPNDFGHSLVAGVITNLLDQIYLSVIKKKDIEDDYRVPEKPLTANRYYDSVRRYNRNTDPVLNGFTKDERERAGTSDVFKYGWYARKAGSSIRFEAEGSKLSVQFCKYAEHPAPVAMVVIDGESENAAVLDANFDETWGNCLYLQDITDSLNPGKHTVEIIITQGVPDKDFYLASIITA